MPTPHAATPLSRRDLDLLLHDRLDLPAVGDRTALDTGPGRL